MGFIIWGIVYIVLFIAFIIYNVIDKNQMKIRYIADNNIIKAKVIGNVVAKKGIEEEHHAVLAYVINGEMYKKECSNGFGKQLYQVGDIVDIKYSSNNFEEIELLTKLEKMKMTTLEIIIAILLPLSSILMFIMSSF